MKRTTILLVVLIAAVAVVYYLLATGGLERKNGQEPVKAVSSVNFMGETLQVPQSWGVYEFGTRGGVLALTRKADHGLNPMLTLEDERTKPEDPARFVSGWENSLRVPGFHPKSLEEYHDTAVDAAGEHCVIMHWDGTQRPLRVICITGNGRWKLTLSGDDDDVNAFDTMAQQLPGFVQNL
jgi:hypothetical protein